MKKLAREFSVGRMWGVAWLALALVPYGVLAAGEPLVGADSHGQNQRLGRGVNILGYDPIWRSRDQARFQTKHFRLLREAGFDSVRINLHPFRQAKREQEWRLPETWFATLDWAVTNALANDLAVVLDLHEFSAMGEDPEGRHELFLATWRQLSAHYQSAPGQVLFEILNEPSRALTPLLWNQYLREALAIIRQSNPVRTVIVGPPSWNAIGHLQELELPAEDRHLIVTVHYYTPMEFTHQGASWSSHKDKSDVEWLGTPEERKAIRDDFTKAAEWSREQDRPILLGEFGAYDRAPMASRARYTDAVARTAESFGWSWSYWQFDSDFILYNIDRDSWVEPLRDALVPRNESGLRRGSYGGRPFQGTPQSVPGVLEGEFYDEGGEGVAYHETDGGNHGSGELNRGSGDLDRFRSDEAVDLSYTKDAWDNSTFNRVPQNLGRLYLGWTAPGEWVGYTVDIERGGVYTVSARYTARYDAALLLQCDGQPVGAPLRLPSTADDRDERRNWHHWNVQERKEAVVLPAGRHVLTLRILDPGNVNLDYLDFQL